MSTKSTNHDFYEEAYTSRSVLKVMVKQFCSYDQLVKTRRNISMITQLPQFSEEMSVLDYGFGHGTFLLRMPRQHQISGCELSREAIKNVSTLCSILRRNVNLYSPSEFAEASKTLKFDLVCCSHVIEHVDDEKSLLELFHSVLAVDGHLLLNVPINEVWVDPNHVRSYTLESAMQTLASAGFRVEGGVEADRWSAWILHYEHVVATRFKLLLRVLRFLLSLLPTHMLDFLERGLPQKYKCQQLLMLAKKT